MGKLRVGASCLVALSIAGFVHAAAPERGATALPAPAAPHEDRLSGRDIYERVLENRFASYIQESALISGDEAGNDQETRLRMWFKSFRDENGGPTEGDLLSKTLVKYTYPFELRHSGYLIINRLDRPNDQFVYLSSHRRVRRVNLRGEAVFGTDFSFEDVIPRELEHAAYQRLPDELLDGVPTFVVEAIPNSEMRSEYSRFLIYVEKQRFVPLRTRYWDDRGIETKELRVEHASIEMVENVWVPKRMTMRNLRYESYTNLVVTEVEPNPLLDRTVFDLRRLEAH